MDSLYLWPEYIYTRTTYNIYANQGITDTKCGMNEK